MNEAKVIIDTSGQSAALLAVGEASIDPNAKTSGESLLSMMGRWLHLDEHVRTIEKSGFSRTDLAMLSSGIKTSAV